MTSAEIIQCWKQFESKKFPRECARVEVAGVCLASADTYLAGCISNFVKHGALDSERIQIVRSVCEDIEKVLPYLKGDGRKYFEELLALGRGVAAHVV